jgi:cytoskeletal protein RodZ
MPAASHTPEPEQPPRRTIGDLLRETRQSFGGQIDQIAGVLRIRAAYLTAIEESRYDRLPAPVYALGFVRAYANHLGLDADEAVRRFKHETASFEMPRGLSFPVPLAERSVPGGTMLLAALILAFCGYGLWYYVSTGERARPERVSIVPSDLKPPSPAPAGGVAPQALPAPDAAPAAAAPTTPPAPETAAPLVAPAAPDAAASGAAPASAPPSPSQVAAAPPSPAPNAPPPVDTVPAPVAALLAPAPPSASTTRAPDAPRVFGAVDEPARIIVNVRKDSWIQIREGNRVLVDRTLRSGDSYRVPDRPGLVMRTGNGSGLDFEVDGRKAPALGGTVRHNIALDPGRLMSGTAISD